jgi:hypothetical protein
MTMARSSAAKVAAEQPPRHGDDRARDDSALTQLMALKQMSVNELRAKWGSLFATPAPNNSRPFLELRLAYRIQELTYGGPGRPADSITTTRQWT